MPNLTDEEIQAIVQKVFDDLGGVTSMRNDGEYYRSPEFKEEVIQELMKHGATRERAENWTRDDLRLHKEAIRLGLK